MVCLLICPWRSSRGEDKVGYLIKTLQTESSLKVRLQAVNFLSQIADERAIAGLRGALKEKHYVIRAAAASALGRLKDRESLEAIRALLKDPNPLVRKEAAGAIQKMEEEGEGDSPQQGSGLAVNGPITIHLLPGKACPKGESLVGESRRLLEEGIRRVSGLVIEAPGAAGAVSHGYSLRSHIVKVARLANGVSCEVALEVLREPRMNVMMITNGEAMVQGQGDSDSQMVSAMRVAINSVIDDLIQFMRQRH